MPRIFKVGSYWVYFWANENDPLEPIHVHISEGQPSANATKIWITQYGKCLVCHNNSHISDKILKQLIRIIEARSQDIIEKWKLFFGNIRYIC